MSRLVRCDGCCAAKAAGWQAWVTHVWMHVQEAKRRMSQTGKP